MIFDLELGFQIFLTEEYQRNPVGNLLNVRYQDTIKVRYVSSSLSESLNLAVLKLD